MKSIAVVLQHRTHTNAAVILYSDLVPKLLMYMHVGPLTLNNGVYKEKARSNLPTVHTALQPVGTVFRLFC